MRYDVWDWSMEPNRVVRLREPIDQMKVYESRQVLAFYLVSKEPYIQTDGKMMINTSDKVYTYPYMHYYYTVAGSKENTFINEMPEEFLEKYYDVVASNSEGEKYKEWFYMYIIDKNGKVKEV